MYTIFKDFHFSAAHAIRGHTRGCQNVHGHNYRVRVFLQASELDSLGMVMDFADLKALTREILEPFDHHLINEVPPFDERNTTAELLSQHIFSEVERRIVDPRVRVSRVEVWENTDSCAIYEPGR